ncbi:2-pyrone-4,6-dicarboxylate hydrolase [Rhizobium leguminosarum]|uniref:2-pyrone-4,6-dicarboxylate hydrolase n=1 Tax=Rhizobium leguminosarum TaxID=384 RepID=A0A2K9ZCG9_RHILE|nr:amidohydrolase family protein [Rhizobium leguminosarum]AUW45929.1 2-pyrone-4,6-dicarboxylate hydrolase [Rhizobium leguminosarum]TBC86598.1 2-pyrone-4,6-dicarboxylate hydrolase [Rhizobium leguminosarum]
MTGYFPFDADPRPPSFAVPSGAIDSQFHVFGPEARYASRPGATYTMPQATFAEARRMHKALHIERGVIVQATTYGMDHSALLDSLSASGGNYRGCAIGAVLNEASDAVLQTLHDAGIRGARFNFLKAVNLAPDPQKFARAVARAAELGWYIKIQPGESGILDHVALYQNLDIPVVIDHMGRPDLIQGVDGPTVCKVRDLLRRGNVWVMLSNGHKLSLTGTPWNDIVPIARSYIDAASERVIWASDWPHPLSKTQPPNDGDLMDLLFRYAGDETTARRILVDNPAHLFGF